MRKLLLLLVVALLMSGCSSKKGTSHFMVTQDQQSYALYNQDGDKLTDYEYQSYEEIKNIGYIVSNDQKEMGLISASGKDIIEMGKYGYLKSTGQMFYAGKKAYDENKLTYMNSDLYVLDDKGEVLCQADKKTSIKPDVLPILKQGNEYIVLYQDGKELYKGKEEILYIDTVNNDKYICLGFKDHMTFYYKDGEETNDYTIDIKTNNQYEFIASHDNGAILNDKKHQNAYYMDNQTKKNYELKLSIENAYYNDEGYPILETKDKTYIYPVSKNPIELNSYYTSNMTYIKRSQDIYGPHIIYSGEDEIGRLENCQLYPNVEYITSGIFPIFVRDKGYQYYNFEGKQVIDQTYQAAEPFDIMDIAIVKTDDKGYRLIDQKGNIVTKDAYERIKYIGSSYYAVYNKVGMFGIIDIEGKEIFPVEYTSLPEKAIIQNDEEHYLLIGKNGRSYVYDIDQNMKEVCSGEGDIEYNSKGYFLIGNTYYTLDGKKIK